jgi:phenylacetate-CoA ligase
MQRFSDKLRSEIFWLFDFIKGKKIKNDLEEIKMLIESGDHDVPASRKKELLNDIIKHAVNTTKYYSRFRSYNSLSDFPVINKTIIRDSFNEFCSGIYKLSDFIPVVTSGSTGTPFKVYHDRRKRIRNHADTIYFAGKAGFDVGDRLLYLKIWAKEKMKPGIVYQTQNIIPVDVLHLNDSMISGILGTVKKDNSSYSIIGYSSALELICRYLDKNNSDRISGKIKSIISISEALNDYTRNRLLYYFNTPVFSRYSNLENGIIAQQTPEGELKFLVNTASYHLEILKMESDEPEEQGKPGRIVVTDLFNYAMPMIRYDTGDIGSFESENSVPGKIFLSQVEGRKLDLLYDTRGELVSSYIVYKNMWKYLEIIQYQLIQEGERQYVMKINVSEEFKREDELVEEFKEYLGSDADFKIQYVNEIPLLASGKRKKIVNNYIKA